MRKTYQFRIYPGRKQEVVLNRTISTCRHLYNNSLADRKKQAELNRLKKTFDVFPWGKPEWINYFGQKLDLTASKTSFQKEVHSQVLQDVIKRVDRSMVNFFRGFGYPRFQGRDRYNSFTYPQSGFKLEDGKLILSKIGSFKIILHREIEGKIKTCTVKRDIDQWYVSFSCEIEEPVPVEIKTKTGIDVGLIDLITLSSGEQVKTPKFLRTSEDNLIHKQKRLSRKKIRSKNRKHQAIIVSKIHRKIRNQRKDFAHKISRMLVDNYDLIKFEEFVNPAGTSQTCICGFSVPKDLSVRIHICPSCGLVMGRDRVSAIIIKHKPSICTVGTTGIYDRQGVGLSGDALPHLLFMKNSRNFKIHRKL